MLFYSSPAHHSSFFSLTPLLLHSTRSRPQYSHTLPLHSSQPTHSVHTHIQPTMASDICFLHFRIHDSTLSSTSITSSTSSSANNYESNDANDSSARQSSTGAKAGSLQEWLCQLSILDDKTTVRGLLGPLVDPERKKAVVLASCCTLQVATVPRATPVDVNNTQGQAHGPAGNKDNSKARVLFAKTIQSEELFRQGVECMCPR